MHEVAKSRESTRVHRERLQPGTNGTSRVTRTTGTGVQMTSDGENDSQALRGGDITKYRALVARSRQNSHALRWQTRQCVTWNESRGSEDTSLGSRQRRAGSAGNSVVIWKRSSDADGRGDAGTVDGRCQLE